jgi:hypothetical protein
MLHIAARMKNRRKISTIKPKHPFPLLYLFVNDKVEKKKSRNEIRIFSK